MIFIKVSGLFGISHFLFFLAEFLTLGDVSLAGELTFLFNFKCRLIIAEIIKVPGVFGKLSSMRRPSGTIF